jgi:hypothetical protein
MAFRFMAGMAKWNDLLFMDGGVVQILPAP